LNICTIQNSDVSSALYDELTTGKSYKKASIDEEKYHN